MVRIETIEGVDEQVGEDVGAEMSVGTSLTSLPARNRANGCTKAVFLLHLQSPL